jgi:hypothetical protein
VLQEYVSDKYQKKEGSLIEFITIVKQVATMMSCSLADPRYESTIEKDIICKIPVSILV